MNHKKFKNISKKFLSYSLWLTAYSFLTGCTTVHLDTPEPLKVDIAMKVNVYQANLPEGGKHSLSDQESEALRRRDNRSAEIWTMKNDGVAIEGKNGYLEARTKSGWDPKYVNQLVTDENHDRHILYEGEALQTARPIAVIEEEAGKRLRRQAYGGPQKPD